MYILDTVSKLRKQLQSVYQLQWLNHIKGFGKDNQHKLRTYCKFKTKFELEPYLTGSIPVRKRQTFSKLRISAHTLAIETGRYTQPKTPLEQRKCSLCDTGSIENEEHVVMLYYNAYKTMRNELFHNLEISNRESASLRDTEKSIYLMQSDDNVDVLKYINRIF